MSAVAAAGSAEAGSRIAEARRAAGLSQRSLAERLGISMWTLDQLEQGRGDLALHAPAIARVTQHPLDVDPTALVEQESTGERRTRRFELSRAAPGTRLVLGSIAALVLIRFFTEVLPVLPRALNVIDIPILFAVALVALTRARAQKPRLSFALPVLLFIGLCVVSVTLNPSRVEPGPALLFVYGFVAPIVVYAAVYRLWPAGNALSVSRLLVALGLVQLVVVFAIDLPRFIATDNPDVISGTFGTNAYQLVFFLLVVTGLLGGILTLEKNRAVARIAPLLFVLILATVFLAQYRALLATTAVTVLLLGLLLGSRARGFVVGTLVVASFVMTLSYVTSRYPELKFAETVATLHENPSFFASKRLGAAGKVADLYADEPLAVVVGTGPGTYSSRAWRTFSGFESESGSNVGGRYISRLTGGRVYRTDVSDKYVLPQVRTGEIVQGSRAVTSPFSSYFSLLAEVGVFGFLLIVGTYLAATIHVLRAARLAIARAVPGDSLPALLVACFVAFAVLLQMAVLENWLEVTRVTFVAWMLLAVAMKELAAREHAP